MSVGVRLFSLFFLPSFPVISYLAIRLSYFSSSLPLSLIRGENRSQDKAHARRRPSSVEAVIVPGLCGKSQARQLEARLIRHLQAAGFYLEKTRDANHLLFSNDYDVDV